MDLLPWAYAVGGGFRGFPNPRRAEVRQGDHRWPESGPRDCLVFEDRTALSRESVHLAFAEAPHLHIESHTWVLDVQPFSRLRGIRPIIRPVWINGRRFRQFGASRPGTTGKTVRLGR